MKPMKSTCLRNVLRLGGLLLLAGTISIQAQTTFTTVAGASGNWSDGTKWAGGVAASGALNIGLLGAGNSTFLLDAPTTMGVINDGQGSARGWTINASGTIAMTMDNTGAVANNPAGTLNAYIGESSSGTMTFNPNIIIQNTDLDVANTGSTTPILAIGILGTSTITATSARNLFIRQNQATSTKAININSSIGGSGSSGITIQNVGTGGGVSTMNLNGVIGPNAGVVQNSASSTLSLNNAANSYTNSTTVTLGTLRLGAANALPSGSSVSVTGTLNLVSFSDTIGDLNGAGTVSSASGTPTLTIGGNNGSGTFSGVIQNAGGTLNLAKTGSGTEVLSGANTYAGTTTINGGFLNAGVADAGSGPFGSGGGIAFGGGTLQYSVANTFDYSSRFSTAANNAISIDTAGQAVTFATALTSSGGSLKLTNSTGTGTLTLTAAETYSGNTTVNGGTLILSGSGALATNSTLNIGAGGTFDVSALASPYTFGSNATLRAGGTGTDVGTNAANIVGASGGIFDAGSQPISMTWGGGSSGTDSTHPSLLVSEGTLNLNTNPITVVVPGTALDVGIYTLISAPAISGVAPNPTPSYTGGNGVGLGKVGVISVSGSSVILTVSAAGGTVGTWINDVDGNWSDGTKWSSNPNVPHLAGDAATLGVGSALRTVTLNTNESVGTLTMTNASSFVIANGGNALTLDNTGSGATVNVTDGTANDIQTAVALNDNAVVTVGSGKSLAFSGIVSNTASAKTILFNGAGTNILSGANSYGPAAGSVGTTLNAGGTLQVGNNSALGAGDLSMSGNGTLQAGAAVSISNNIAIADATTMNNNGNNLTLSGAISGAGGISKINNGRLTLSGTNTYGGDTTVNAGVLSISSQDNVANSPNLILNGGGLLGSATFAAANNIGIGAASGAVGTNALIDAASGQAVTLNGVIATAGNGGTDGLIVNSGTGNNGTLILGGANTFNGTTVISNGTLQVANTLALQNSGLNYNTGTLLFDSSVSAARLGGLSSANGSQNIGLTNTAGSLIALTVGGNNVATIYGGNLTDGGLGGSFVKTGSGSMTLSNANYSGGTTVNGTAALTILGGTFGSASSAITVGTAGGGNTFLMSGGTATASAFNLAILGGQTGVGATINGTANLTNTATTIGSGGNTAGAMTLNTAGNVNLGNVKINKDAGNITVASTGSGLIITGGNVIAASMNIAQSGTAARAADLNINGGSLTIADASQTGMFAIHSGAGSGFLTMSGGTLNYLGTDGLQMSIGAGTSVAVISGGTANLTGVTLNSGSAATTSTLTVNGTNNPTLYLGSVGLIINLPSPTVTATFGNATIGAMADWASDAPITLTNNPVFKAADAANVPHSITLSNVLSGTGNLTKIGNGTLTLMGANTYTGNTIVGAGTLDLLQASLFNNSTVSVSNGATLMLDFSGTNIVAGLILNGVSKAAGVYNNGTDPTFLTSTGYIQVQPLVSLVPTDITSAFDGANLTLSWPADHIGWRLQSQTNSLSVGLGTNWADVSGSTTTNQVITPMDAANGSVFFRMIYP